VEGRKFVGIVHYEISGRLKGPAWKAASREQMKAERSCSMSQFTERFEGACAFAAAAERVEFLGWNAVRIGGGGDCLPIEVSVLGRLPGGAGRFLLANAFRQQGRHPEFAEEFNEPSARIGPTDFARQDATAVYTFGVGKRDLVFHRHAGHRAITGITGGRGCQLKFSLCSPQEARHDPWAFFRELYVVRLAPDRLFSLRFSGTVYHQFGPLSASEDAFFAVSVHTNEAGGLRGPLRDVVLADRGNIPLLTEPAPAAVQALLHSPLAQRATKFIDLGWS
jgi:hypothetical protein